MYLFLIAPRGAIKTSLNASTFAFKVVSSSAPPTKYSAAIGGTSLSIIFQISEVVSASAISFSLNRNIMLF